MTPRHPPRALGGLTTPTRPPRRPGPRGAQVTGVDRDDARSNLPSVPRPAASCDGAGRPFSTAGRRDPVPRQDGPTSPRAFVERLILPLPRRLSNRDACVTNDRIVKDASRADDGSGSGL